MSLRSVTVRLSAPRVRDALQALGWQVDLFGPESCELWPKLRLARSYRLALGMLQLAQSKLQSCTYDIVEFYGGESWLAASVLARQPGRRHLLVSHSNGLESYASEMQVRYLGSDTYDGAPRRWYQRGLSDKINQAFSAVDGLATVSTAEREYALAQGYQSPHRVVGIDNPLPSDYLRLDCNFERPLVLGFCGSWIPRKGTQLLVEDITRFLVEQPAWSLKLIGVGDKFDPQAYFPREICARIEIFPFLPDRQALRDAYRSLAILIAPSIYESFGMSIAEAMACGCAVVASRTGFAANLEDGREVLLLEEPTTPYLYQQVRTLALDEGKRRAIAMAGYARVQRLCWESAAGELASAYSGWLEEFHGEGGRR
jgi:glycosyltransferase involved in cell wall biosynthesis